MTSGAETAATRAALASRPRSEVPHGTPSGYRNWGCRCGECTAARSSEARQQRRTARPAYAIPHGTRSGYHNWGCRCERCKAAGLRDVMLRRGLARQRQGLPLTPGQRAVLAGEGRLDGASGTGRD